MRRHFLFFSLASWILLFPGRLFAAEPSIQAEIQPNQARLGDVLKLTVRVVTPNGSSVELPSIPSTLGPFEVRRSSPLPASVSGEMTVSPFEVELQAFTTGVLTLPAIE